MSSFEKELNSKIDSLPEDHIIMNYREPHAKISRGENYEGLPYFILDYPRVFSTENTFAFRTMVYWAGFFSFTAHFSGTTLEFAREKLLHQSLKEKNIYLCVGKTPWAYHYRPDNYLPIHSLTAREIREIIEKKPFIKISEWHPLSKYENLTQCGLLFYQKILSILD